jgi:hypothetical protein
VIHGVSGPSRFVTGIAAGDQKNQTLAMKERPIMLPGERPVKAEGPADAHNVVDVRFHRSRNSKVVHRDACDNDVGANQLRDQLITDCQRGQHFAGSLFRFGEYSGNPFLSYGGGG